MKYVVRTIKNFFMVDEPLGWMVCGLSVGVAVSVWRPPELGYAAFMLFVGFGILVYCRVRK